MAGANAAEATLGPEFLFDDQPRGGRVRGKAAGVDFSSISIPTGMSPPVFWSRAQDAGYEAVVLTVDTPVLGARSREARSSFALPTGMEKANFKGVAGISGNHRPTGFTIYSDMHDAKLTWHDVAWLRSQTRLPILLKGILDPDDARRAVDSGASGIVVSNHGGRVLDTVPATIDALPGVADAVASRILILVDGGITRGTDVVKALAHGASAPVLIGRPYAYGLAVGGAEGVARVINLLRREFEMAMALTGRTSLASIDRTVDAFH